MTRIECSVWSNGSNGFGITILGGALVRRQHFDRLQSPVLIELDGEFVSFNVDKDSFWKDQKDCRHLINKTLKSWFQARSLKTGDHIWLEIIQPGKRFRLVQ